jgi:hypothetical protein
MTYFLANARGRDNARHWLEYVASMEPDSLDRIRIGLALAPSGREEEFSAREISSLRRRVHRALATARRRWGLPLGEAEEDVFYINLPDDAGPSAVRPEGVYRSRNERASILWGTTPAVISNPEPHEKQPPLF